jgi:sulfite reductase alpha subunit
MQRVGLGNFMEAIGVEPTPEMIAHPRENPYVFYEEYYEADEEEEESEALEGEEEEVPTVVTT